MSGGNPSPTDSTNEATMNNLEYALPDLEKLQSAHYELFKKYNAVINFASKQSFFIDAFEFIEFNRPESSIGKFIATTIRVIFYPFRKLFSIFCWKPLVIFFIESHFRDKSLELSLAYTQFATTLSTKKKYYIDYQNWLISASRDCNNLSNTLASWKTVVQFIGKVGASILVLLNAKNIFDLILRINEHTPVASGEMYESIGLVFQSIFSSLYILVPLFVSSFFTKRAILYPRIEFIFFKRLRTTSQNVYVVEDNLFNLLGRQKNSEIPIDLFVLSSPLAITLIFIAIAAWLTLPKSQLTNSGFWLGVLIVLSPIIIMNLWFIYDTWRTRKWK